jgi:deazaflavin-dependent oxidoreductase (nitroreductase family)
MAEIPADIHAYNTKLIQEFRAGGGPPAGRPLLLLTTTGARTGQARTTPMMFIADGERLLVIASNSGAPSHPDWYRNLLAHPEVTVESGAETYPATAIPLQGEERDRRFARIVEDFPFFADHQAKITRTIPVVALVRLGPS